MSQNLDGQNERYYVTFTLWHGSPPRQPCLSVVPDEASPVPRGETSSASGVKQIT